MTQSTELSPAILPTPPVSILTRDLTLTGHLPPQELKQVLVVGASGGIGQAFCQALITLNPSITLIRFARTLTHLDQAWSNPNLNSNTRPAFDYTIDLADESTFEPAITACKNDLAAHQIDFKPDWVLIATGWLHDPTHQPEKTYQQLEAQTMLYSYQVNAVGPILWLKMLLQALPLRRNSPALKIGVLSARVGSISDNRLGGWHSYRASKAALNMLLKNLAIELQRNQKPVIVVGLQPGTTHTALSAPFQKGLTPNQVQTPAYTAQQLIKVMQALVPQDSGELFDFLGLPFAP
ncbi:SDR family NAD(P)-dependent oxidoreductase [Thiomicrorhabdus aquaedulcis]|uniref:SDR family NAD(P)-dependent oxidoreductase n=1 Tax=Thiomicrorhabdus aquaedulcis TaxID=2211106 RepID=UPI000FD71ADC|nr:SDR family NAD(P)-dependent oxidoreductase [Thiomicrorhabdus aquaedulcis]